MTMPASSQTAAVATAAARAHGNWTCGMKLAREARWPEAVRAFGRATRAAPRDGIYWVNLANAQRHAGAFGRAIAAARRCLDIAPADPLALRLVGDCCLQMHRYAEAEQAFSALEGAGHLETDAMLQHASVLQAQGRADKAAPVLLRALAKDPTLVRAHALLADVCRDRGLKREAIECMKTVLALEPGNLEGLARMSFEKRHLCDWSDLDADIEAVSKAIDALAPDEPRIAAVFSILSLPLAPELHLKAARAEVLALAAVPQALPTVLPSARADSPQHRVRLGMLSFDFREHPVSQLLVEVLEQIDRRRFELLLYSCGPDDNSALRCRVVAAADSFIDINGLSDAQAAERIRADGVDLLVDLMGHTRGHRLGIFARKPAPVQASYLGFPGSTGLPAIDYLIGDPLVTPIEAAGLYSEKLAQLPLTLQPNGTGRPLPQPMARRAAGLPEGAFVMCAFNHTYKIGPEAFDIWCSLLRELPHAVLWLKETNAQFHGNVLRAAAERGVSAERIVFAPVVSYAEHFSRLALADVFVDTWPYGGHTTASDALWAGVPVVTRYGSSYASRVAASVVNAAGQGELAFGTADDYRTAILVLALEPGLLATYKAQLVRGRATLPLFDTARYTGELMALFDRMLARWRSGQPAEHLPAERLPAHKTQPPAEALSEAQTQPAEIQI